RARSAAVHTAAVAATSTSAEIAPPCTRSPTVVTSLRNASRMRARSCSSTAASMPSSWASGEATMAWRTRSSLVGTGERLRHLRDQLPEPLEALGQPLGVERRRGQHEARDAQVAHALDVVGVGDAAARRHLDGLRIAADLLALLLHDAEEPEELLLVGDTGEEAVAVTCRAARGQLGVSADDDRNPALLH